MSLKLSALAFDEMQEQRTNMQSVIDFSPELQIVKPRGLRNQGFSTATSEEVVYITGKFTVSF